MAKPRSGAGDLVRVLKEAGEAEAARVLEAWDNHVATGSKGAVLFLDFFQEYLRKSKKPYARPWDPARPASTPSGLGDPQPAVEAIRLAAARVPQT